MKTFIRTTVFVICMAILATVMYWVATTIIVPWILNFDELLIVITLIGLVMFGFFIFCGIGEFLAKKFGWDKIVDKFVENNEHN